MTEVPDHIAVLSVDIIRDSAEVRAANYQRRDYTHLDQCFVCGRGLTEDAVRKAWWVHVVGCGGLLAANDLGPVEDDEDMGWMPVGSGCVRRVPLRFRMRDA